jgi:hypothetical protein
LPELSSHAQGLADQLNLEAVEKNFSLEHQKGVKKRPFFLVNLITKL